MSATKLASEGAGADFEDEFAQVRKPGNSTDLFIQPSMIARNLSLLVLFFGLMNMVGPVSADVFGHGNLLGFVPLSRKLFALHGELNIPTWFSSWLLLSCAIFAYVVSRSSQLIPRWDGKRWGHVAILFAYLSLDEVAMLHESFDEMAMLFLRPEHLEYVPWLWPGHSNTPTIPWVAVGVPLVLILVTWLSPWILRLPRRTLLLFTLSGFLFVGGAAGIELTTWKFVSMHSPDSLPRATMITIEEVMEMLGVIMALYAILDFAQRHDINVRLIADSPA